ncbi:hypothetical protein [uncultured Bacteroides sp.]|jgi:hypothetical protein|uniref:hypothetical protein n=1 Tax=uncultured Bacteroides sp. TaxID=162156 RepID=UPI0025FCE98E|nr:hypothetical protein [uncultured Bacteroides sp.]
MNKKTIAYTCSLRAAHSLHAAFGLLAALLVLLAACQNENDQLLPPDPNPVGPNSTILDPDPDGGNLRLTTPIVALDATNDAGSTRSNIVPYDAMTLQIRLLSADGTAYRQQEATYTYTAPAASPDGNSTDGTWTLTSATAPAVSAPGRYRIRALARLLRHDDQLPMLAYFDGTTTITTDGTTTAPDGTGTAHFTLALRPAAAQLRLRLKDINGRIITDGTLAALRATNPDLKDATNDDPTLLAHAAADEATFDALQTYENALWHALLPTHIFTTDEADAFDPKPDTETAWAPDATALPLDHEYYTTPAQDADNIATAPILRRSPTYLSDARSFVLADVYPNGTLRYSDSNPVGIPGGTPLFEVTHLGKNYTVTLPSGATPLTLSAGTITTLSVTLGPTDATVEEIEIADMDENNTSIGISNSDIRIIGTDDNGQPIYAIYNEKGLMKFAHIVMGTAADGSVGDGTGDDANLAACGRLMADIYLPKPADPTNGSNWTPLGNYSTNIRAPYTGTFDGGGHTVFGLVINRPDADEQGFFGRIGSNSDITPATVKNLTVEGIVTGRDNTGGIVGNNANGILRNCRNEGSVEGRDNVGGVTGISHNFSTIIACTNTGSVESTGTGSAVGGVVGCTPYAIITACTNTGNVEGTGSAVGGVVGYTPSSTITACINTGSVKGTSMSSNIGGVVGYTSSSTITTCFWQSINGQPDKGIGTGFSSSSNTITDITTIGTPGIATLKEKWRLACGDYQLSGDGTLNKALHDWNAGSTGSQAYKFCPYRFAENPEYDNADAQAAATAGKSYPIAPLLLVPIDQ